MQKKQKCLLEGKCQIKAIVVNCVVSLKVNTDKAYLATAEGSFIKRFYNHSTPFSNRNHANDSARVQMKSKHSVIPILNCLTGKTYNATKMSPKNTYCISMKSSNYSITPVLTKFSVNLLNSFQNVVISTNINFQNIHYSRVYFCILSNFTSSRIFQGNQQILVFRELKLLKSTYQRKGHFPQ